jgi:endonuclease III
LLQITGVLPDVNIEAALRRLVKSPRWTELNRRALARGRELARVARPDSSQEVCSEG